jgi:putative glutamine amidotransferase
MTRVLALGSTDEATVPAPFLPLELNAKRTVARDLEARGCSVLFVDIAHQPRPDVAELVDDVAGLVILGGADVDPTLYGLPADLPKVYGVNRAADDFSIAVIRRAEELGIPMLCICRGMQILNVAHGGTLIPDIEDWAIHHGPDAENIFVVEDIAVEPHSRLAIMVGTDRLAVRNGHHQAIATVGEGLMATAWSADGIVEAVETKPGTAWTVGVQWHPEHPGADPAARQALFDGFVAQMRVANGPDVPVLPA